jgi:hypothetical protein
MDSRPIACIVFSTTTPACAARYLMPDAGGILHRFEGTCIKHRLGKAQVVRQFSRVLRLETTVNEVSFFKHHRKVEHRSAPDTRELAPLKKTIHSVIDLRNISRRPRSALSRISIRFGRSFRRRARP